jgi:hypothetical protein
LLKREEEKTRNTQIDKGKVFYVPSVLGLIGCRIQNNDLKKFTFENLITTKSL